MSVCRVPALSECLSFKYLEEESTSDVGAATLQGWGRRPPPRYLVSFSELLGSW